MRQVVYISTSPNLGNDQIDAILESSLRNNEPAGITGFLLYNGRNFLQLVEGSESALMDLMGKLAVDKRHTGMVRLHDEEIETRHCPEWAMYQIHLSDNLEERRAAIQNEIPCEISSEIQRLVSNFAGLN